MKLVNTNMEANLAWQRCLSPPMHANEGVLRNKLSMKGSLHTHVPVEEHAGISVVSHPHEPFAYSQLPKEQAPVPSTARWQWSLFPNSFGRHPSFVSFLLFHLLFPFSPILLRQGFSV